MTIPRSLGPGFLCLFWPGMSVTIPRTRSVRPECGHWRPSLNYIKKKKKKGLKDSGMAIGVKKTSLWDRGMASDVRMRTVIEKKTPVWQTVVWPLRLKEPGLSDRGVANGVAKFRMASGGLKYSSPKTEIIHLHPYWAQMSCNSVKGYFNGLTAYGWIGQSVTPRRVKAVFLGSECRP